MPTVVLAWLFLRDLERVTWRIAVASVLVVVGVVLVIAYGTR
jgi:drug/metabolite transporter (DMT)-like permease